MVLWFSVIEITVIVDLEITYSLLKGCVATCSVWNVSTQTYTLCLASAHAMMKVNSGMNSDRIASGLGLQISMGQKG